MVEHDFAEKCVAIDLEVGRNDDRIHKFAAIRGNALDAPFVSTGVHLNVRLAQLDEFATGADFLVGHNLISFDLKHLRAAAPDLRLLNLPALDTLRLSPLAFPRNPHHHLIKHYQDGSLVRSKTNDPELDSRLCLQLFTDEQAVLRQMRDGAPQLLAAWHYLCSATAEDVAFDHFFEVIRGQPKPETEDALTAMEHCMRDLACPSAIRECLTDERNHAWPMAYALAWLSVAGSNSVMPPWVRHQFPGAADMVRRLRDTRCNDDTCPWCDEHHNPLAVLKKWFNYPEFRPEPPCPDDGRPMQQAIVEAAMRREDVLGILPTGTGKSVCYQIPALSRYENTGALTVIISPLQALMADQVAGLEARGIISCAALNGLLSMPERHDVLQKVRLGDIAMLIVSPEQLRNPGFRKAVKQREIGAWVLDEAHCLSKWGQDFRTDYRYVGRFIRESAGDNPSPPVLCLTATAKPDVAADICAYFKRWLDADLTVFNGGSSRPNLIFEVMETTEAHKLNDIHQVLAEGLPEAGGGAIVYCATRAKTQLVAQFLSQHGWTAAHFHAGLSPEMKKTTQSDFLCGNLRVIVATNAFGMGIDKPDVRLVIHADIPGSLENYVQEAGRAGRDRDTARCILLYSKDDVETQFRLSSSSKIACHEIQRVLRTLRRMAGKRRDAKEGAEVVATPGEIMSEDAEAQRSEDPDRVNTRVRTAIAWLEEARLVFREENAYQVFPSSLRVTSAAEAVAKLQSVEMPYRDKLRLIVEELLRADSTEAITTDELMGVADLSSAGIRKALYDLERMGLTTDDTRLTVHVHAGVENSSNARLESVVQTEKALIGLMREMAPDMEKGETHPLHLRAASNRLQEAGCAGALPERIFRLLQSIAADGRSEKGGTGSIQIRKVDAEFVQITLRREWDALEATASLRRTAAACLLAHLLERLSPEARKGVDLVSETTLGALHAAIEDDLELKGQVRKPEVLIERGLMWLHEQEVLTLGKGMIIFKPAMTLRVPGGSEPFTQDDYRELGDHYREQAVQIFVMQEYAKIGLQRMREAAALVLDYFQSARNDFIAHWFRGRETELERQTTAESWAAIVEALNSTQRQIVKDDREKTNVLVLAGPGSGKTRVLVHRIAYLVRARRENPVGILALAYNRHAAVQIRQRLQVLIGEDAKCVTVLTCHALAMRLTGTSFQDKAPSDGQFAEVVRSAVALLRGEGMLPDETDEQRDRLLSGFRWILVDEYQDVAQEQYDLISALAGRTLTDAEHRLSLFAVGDDDQNIYAFSGASVEFIRRFQKDYGAKPAYLIENYRSSGHIIAAANAVIAAARDRMKHRHDIRIDEARKEQPAGGRWESLDPDARGRVQILADGDSFEAQAAAVMDEMSRLSSLDNAWNWCRCAIIAREWRILDAVRAWCAINRIPVQMANDQPASFWFLRETQALLAWLNTRNAEAFAAAELHRWMDARGRNDWWELLRTAVSAYELDCGGDTLVADHFRAWLYEWGCEFRREQRGLLLLTAHRAKGLEFDHVAVLDGGWNRTGQNEDADAARRLYYVAMTRARETLLLSRMEAGHPFLDLLPVHPFLVRRSRTVRSASMDGLDRQYMTLEMGEVDLGFSGRSWEWDPVHKDIQHLQPGDELTFIGNGDSWYLHNHAGRRVCRLSKQFAPPNGMRCIDARVHAVIVWSKGRDDSEYAAKLHCDQWEVILPELVFAPERSN